jgi:iron complex transport system permease protein
VTARRGPSTALAGPGLDAFPTPARTAAERRRRFATRLAALGLLGLLAGLATGPQGLDLIALQADFAGEQARLILGEIRAPRTVGALLVGALLGLAGALAQGLFRNPLADPYLLGSAAGAGVGVVAVLAVAGAAGVSVSLGALVWLERSGLVVAAFVGALVGVALTLALARGAEQSLRLLLAGVVVAVLLAAVSDLITTFSPQALRARQAFLLGNTGLLGWASVGLMSAGLGIAGALALRRARVLDALTLGEDTAASLGLDIGRLRLVLVAAMSLATAIAVSQAGLVAFVGLVAPHLVCRQAPGDHRWLLAASAAAGGVLLLWADIGARSVLAPQEIPVGVVTAVIGGLYLFVLLRRRVAA